MVDALGITIEVGDVILFPAPGELMEARVTSLSPITKGRYGYDSLNCVTLVTNNNKKKNAKDCINKTKIQAGLPEYSL
jgi:hypothetical protein